MELSYLILTHVFLILNQNEKYVRQVRMRIIPFWEFTRENKEKAMSSIDPKTMNLNELIENCSDDADSHNDYTRSNVHGAFVRLVMGWSLRLLNTSTLTVDLISDFKRLNTLRAAKQSTEKKMGKINLSPLHEHAVDNKNQQLQLDSAPAPTDTLISTFFFFALKFIRLVIHTAISMLLLHRRYRYHRYKSANHKFALRVGRRKERKKKCVCARIKKRNKNTHRKCKTMLLNCRAWRVGPHAENMRTRRRIIYDSMNIIIKKLSHRAMKKKK